MSHVKFVFSSFHILDLNILTCENKVMSHVNKGLAPHVEFTLAFFTHTLKINYGTWTQANSNLNKPELTEIWATVHSLLVGWICPGSGWFWFIQFALGWHEVVSWLLLAQFWQTAADHLSAIIPRAMLAGWGCLVPFGSLGYVQTWFAFLLNVD